MGIICPVATCFHLSKVLRVDRPPKAGTTKRNTSHIDDTEQEHDHNLLCCLHPGRGVRVEYASRMTGACCHLQVVLSGVDGATADVKH